MRAIDVSRWQGDINWAAVQAPIAIIKMSGGDDGLYLDSKANRNYAGAKAAGKAIGMYHFAGGKNAIEEADYFVRACSPLEKNDVLILDWEVQHPDPVGWCVAFIQRVIDQTGIRPMIYMNSNTASVNNWQRVVDMNVGLWVAHYGLGPNDNVPVGKFPTYIMHQYTSGGSEPGIAGRVDVNEWFGTVAQFQKYGFQGNIIQDVTPAPVPVPAPSVPPPAPVEPPVPTPVETPKPDPVPVETPPAPLPTKDNNPIRPKIKAAGVAGIVLTLLLGLLNALYPGNTPTAADAAPLVAALTTIVTVGAGYLKRDGLSPK